MRKAILPLASLLLVTSAPPSYGQTDAEICAALLPQLRQLARDATVFTNAAVGILPYELQVAEPTPDRESHAREIAEDLPAPIAWQAGELGAAVIRLRNPLADYSARLAEALVAAEICAGQ
jgi:hypothetical protein